MSWEGKTYFLRSSFETEYANYLDRNHIKYDVEKIRIKYFDTQLNKERIAIPDFYLPEYNTLVEIKSSYTIDVQNLKDKFKSYEKLGYKVKLIYDHKETDINLIEEPKHTIKSYKNNQN